MTELKEMWYILYHGTKKKNVKCILSYGFNEDTYFAKNMKDALRFGGPYIFEVIVPRSYAPDWFSGELCWQIRCKEVVTPDRIVGLVKITEKVLIDNKKLRDEVFERSLPYYTRGYI